MNEKKLQKLLDISKIVIQEQELELKQQKELREKQLSTIDSIVNTFEKSNPNVNEAMLWLRKQQH